MMRWYVAQTQPQAKASWHLRNQGFVVYLPRYMKRRRHARHVDWVSMPLFPRYRFIGMDLAVARWRAVHSTFGIARLICHGDQPTPVPSGIVKTHQAREWDGHRDAARHPAFREGRAHPHYRRRLAWPERAA
jgi:transcriptional antiterminator RfaH